MTLWEQINADLKKSMQSKEALRLSALRMMKSKIMLVDTKGKIEDKEVLKILNKYAKDLKEAISMAKTAQRLNIVETTEKELKIVEEYLPQEISDEELEKLVKDAITNLGINSIKETGKVMKEIMAAHPAFDGFRVKALVQKLLS